MKLFFIILVLYPFLVSCNYLEGRFWLYAGNYSYDRGDYINSTTYYNRALSKNNDLKAWVYYNLGVSYTALSENESAIEMWEKAKEVANSSLLFYIYYNEGVVFFYQGFYEQAFNCFSQALKINSNDYEAKVNLEITLEKMKNFNSLIANENKMHPQKHNNFEVQENDIKVLESFKKDETSQWIANRKITTLSTEPDY